MAAIAYKASKSLSYALVSNMTVVVVKGLLLNFIFRLEHSMVCPYFPHHQYMQVLLQPMHASIVMKKAMVSMMFQAKPKKKTVQRSSVHPLVSSISFFYIIIPMASAVNCAKSTGPNPRFEFPFPPLVVKLRPPISHHSTPLVLIGWTCWLATVLFSWKARIRDRGVGSKLTKHVKCLHQLHVFLHS